MNASFYKNEATNGMMRGTTDNLPHMPLKNATTKMLGPSRDVFPEFTKSQINATSLLKISDLQINPMNLKSEGTCELLSADYSQLPKLKLVKIEGITNKGVMILIGPDGIIGGKKNGGITYFGNLNGKLLNDYNFPSDEIGIGGRHFYIRYAAQKYFIKDQSEGSGTFVKIRVPIKLHTGYIISFGDNHMTVSVSADLTTLALKFLEGLRKDEKVTFSCDDMPITIGRVSGNTIVIAEISLSKKQCKITHHDDGFYLHDGDGNVASTNGTWLFIEKETLLEQNDVIKAGQSLYMVEIYI